MADYKKVIELTVNASSAKAELKNLFKDFDSMSNASAKKLQSIFSFDDNQSNIFKEIREASKNLKLAEMIGDKSSIKELKTTLNELYDSLRKSGEAGERFVKAIRSEIAATQALEASSALMSFAGLSSEQSRLESMSKNLEALKGIDPELARQAKAVLDGQMTTLKKIANLQAEINALEIIGSKDENRKKKLLEEIAKLQKSIANDANKELSAKQKLAKDAKTAASNLNPFNKERMDRFKENGKYESVGGAILGKMADKLYESIANAIKKIGEFFVNTFKESFESLKQMATYDAGTSLFSNRSARERQLTFGLSGAQNYAMSTAMNMLGMQDVSDLMWANSGQKAQYDRITAILEAQYNHLESSGILSTTQQFQLDMAMMKLQFQNTVYQFIAAHRPALEALINLSFKFMDGVLSFLSTIVDGVSTLWGGNYAASDILSSSSTTNNSNVNNSRTITATVNYTNNQGDSNSGNSISESVLNQLIAVLNE